MIPETVDESETKTNHSSKHNTPPKSQIYKSVASNPITIATPNVNTNVRSSPAFDLISVECIAQNGGVESHFVSNTKLLVKYNLTHEVI